MSKSLSDAKTIETVFQTLLVFQIILFFVTIFVSIVDTLLTGQAVTDLVGEQEMSTAWAIISGLLFVFVFAIALPAYLASIVGLFFWKVWARRLYCGTWFLLTILMLAYSAFDFQWDFHWGLPNSIDNLSSAVAGATLALMAIPPVATRFTSQVQHMETSN